MFVFLLPRASTNRSHKAPASVSGLVDEATGGRAGRVSSKRARVDMSLSSGAPLSILTVNTKHKRGGRCSRPLSSAGLGETTSVQHRGQGGTLPATEKGLRAGRAQLRATHAVPSLAGPVGSWGSACGPVARSREHQEAKGDSALLQISYPSGTHANVH